MTPEEQLKLKNFFKTEEGKLLKEKFIDILVYYSDIRNTKNFESSQVRLALEMFIRFIEEIFGEINEFDFTQKVEEKRRKFYKNYLYKIEE